MQIFGPLTSVHSPVTCFTATCLPHPAATKSSSLIRIVRLLLKCIPADCNHNTFLGTYNIQAAYHRLSQVHTVLFFKVHELKEYKARTMTKRCPPISVRSPFEAVRKISICTNIDDESRAQSLSPTQTTFSKQRTPISQIKFLHACRSKSLYRT